MNAIAPLSLSDRFALTLAGLCRGVAARSFRGAVAGVVILAVWGRLKRIETKVQGLLARFLAGRLRVRPAAPGGRPTVAAETDPGGRRGGGNRSGLPRGFGWLIQMVPYEAACFGSQLRVLLSDPEMEALLRASPQARRVLAPLCRALAIEAEVLAPKAEAGLEAAQIAVPVAETPGRGDGGIEGSAAAGPGDGLPGRAPLPWLSG